MEIEQYQETFESYRAEALKQREYSCSMEQYQKAISALSFRAATFYRDNCNFGKPDYEIRVKEFLDFDQYLKECKKKFASQLEQQRHSLSFFGGNEEKEPLLGINASVSSTPKY